MTLSRLGTLARRAFLAFAFAVLAAAVVVGLTGCAPAQTTPAAPVYVGSVVVVRSPSGGSLRGVNAPGDVAGTTSPSVDTDTDADLSLPPADVADVVAPAAKKPAKPAPVPAPADPSPVK